MTNSKLTDKQKKFCKEYLIDLNATQAAIRAGYSEKTANEQGARLLVNVSIKKEIQRLQANIESKYELRLEDVLSDIADTKKRAKECNDLAMELKASDMQMKHLGAYTQKIEMSGDLSITSILTEGIKRVKQAG